MSAIDKGSPRVGGAGAGRRGNDAAAPSAIPPNTDGFAPISSSRRWSVTGPRPDEGLPATAFGVFRTVVDATDSISFLVKTVGDIAIDLAAGGMLLEAT
jgi:hypothetical protein